MGAELRIHIAPWLPDPKAALKALQTEFFNENYDLSALLPKELVAARESVAAVEANGDEYGLSGIYKERVRLLERLCDRPIPEAADAQIEILRNINAAFGEIGNVLDVKWVSRRRCAHHAQQLDEDETERLAGSAQPTAGQAHGAIHGINEELRWGEWVCFPVYDNGEPTGWCFVGNTVD